MDRRARVVGGLATVVALAAGGLFVADHLGLRGFSGQATGTPLKANVLLIIADDMGVDKVGVYAIDADPDYESNALYLPQTPVIDGLAANGARFTDAWANPSCSPTRAAMYTGTHTLRNGIGMPLGSDGQDELDVGETTIAHVLSDEGYATGLFGKWHLGEGTRPSTWAEEDVLADHVGEFWSGPTHPNELGWEQFTGMLHGALNKYDNVGYSDWTALRSRYRSEYSATINRNTEYATTSQVDNALGWIGHQTGRWFVTVAFNAPHSPWEAPPADCGYSSTGTSDPALFQQMVECLDEELGRLLAGIDDLDDTLIIFVGDNGSDKKIAEDVFDDGRGKNTLYESGIRVPFIVTDGRAWLQAQSDFAPSADWRNSALFVADPGIEIADPVHVVDLFATMAEAGQADASSGVDSISLMPLLGDTEGDIPGYAYSELWKPTGGGTAALRQDAYKLIVTVTERPTGICRSKYELYDMVNDRFEADDLSDEDPTLLAELTTTIDEIASSEGGSWLDVSDCS